MLLLVTQKFLYKTLGIKFPVLYLYAVICNCMLG